jgi:hypothetical protein
MSSDNNPANQEFLSLKRSVTLGVLFFVCFGVYVVLACSLPHDRYIRYQQLTNGDLFRTRWVYERIHFDKTPIDVAIIGSSRVEAGIRASELEDFLSRRAGHPVHVANLAIPKEGRNLHYVVAKDLMETHPETRMIFVSVVEQADTTHAAFRYLADVKELVRAPLLINHFYILDLAFVPYRQMSDFLQTRFPKWFGVSRTFRDDYAGTGFDTTMSFRLPSGRLVDRDQVESVAGLEADSKEFIRLYGRWDKQGAWQRMNNPLETVYTERLAEEARAHCVSVVFLRLPFYKSPEHFYDEALYRRWGSLIDAQELSTEPSNFGNAGHLNRYGTERAMAFLENQIALRWDELNAPRACVAKP